MDRAKTMKEELQVVKKREKEGNDNGWEDDPDAQIAMVDQLWLWVMDDETVITCFPGNWGPEGKNDSRTDLLDTIRTHIRAERRPQISSVYHLVTMITSLCVGYVEHCRADLENCKDSFLHMFVSSIRIAADEEVNCFETFKASLSNPDKPVKPEKENGILREIVVLEEIKDIRDELNILRSILDDQRGLLRKLWNVIVPPQPTGARTTKNDPVLHYYQERSDIDLRIEKVEKMEIDAKNTYDSINHLLDLRQKNANLQEAVQASKQANLANDQAARGQLQAQEAVKQGRIILVFTLVTIIFLPLSFLTSLYALNVDSFPHQGSDFIYPDRWIFPRIFGTSTAIAIPLVSLAIYVNPILDWYKDTFRPRFRESPARSPPRFRDGRSRRESGHRLPEDEGKGKDSSPVPTPSQIESQQTNTSRKRM
ncbi:hypothetical protein BJ875DRAFT_449161 [Amylocarpus encephaloides]|uniref:Ankyrin repeat protein n=1 Tax=Amylocarpus encephaloides TaxID=45428 RepID=A0A9P8C9T4_9HELO|nr:hypothetical protein BJ875DRAFT_449161 [Amylocarpus encephaloides]